MADHREARVSQGGEGVPRRKPAPPPKAPPAAPDDARVEQLLRLYPDHDSCRWVQQLVGWQRRSDAIEAEVVSLRAQLERMRPIVAHVAGLIVQDDDGYSQVHLALIEAALAALPSTDETETK